MELAAAVFLTTIYLVETVTPVDTHHTNHRQEDTNTDTGRTFQIKRIFLDTNVIIDFILEREGAEDAANVLHSEKMVK